MTLDVIYVRGVLAVAVMSICAAAQTSAVVPPSRSSTNSTGTNSSSDKARQCQPYSAETEPQLVRILADGTRIVSPPQRITYYRDSEGRVRTETTLGDYPALAGPSPPVVSVTISDPVAEVQYYFDSNRHVATRRPLGLIARRASKGCVAPGRPAAGGDAATPPGISRQYRPLTSKEQLGTKTIDGVIAEGSRTTTIWPVGSIGNDRPLSTVTEVWTSPELGIELLRTQSDPRTGDFTMRLTNLSRAGPDPALFKPPASYQIQDLGSVPNQR